MGIVILKSWYITKEGSPAQCINIKRCKIYMQWRGNISTSAVDFIQNNIRLLLINTKEDYKFYIWKNEMYGGNMEIIAVIGIYKKSDSFH
jgi:hypothetical protein